MKKKLFKNYTFEFDKNEIKILQNFCRQLSNQMNTDDRFFKEVKVINNFSEKLQSGEEQIKVTKDEKRIITLHLKENVKHINEKLKKAWFFKKWLYKTMYNQYNNLLIKYFMD